MKLKFGDIIENEWASEDNPTRIGIFVRRVAKGYQLTNGKGTFWTLRCDNPKIKVVGSVLKEDSI